MENPIKMDDWGGYLFLETPKSISFTALRALRLNRTFLDEGVNLIQVGGPLLYQL